MRHTVSLAYEIETHQLTVYMVQQTAIDS